MCISLPPGSFKKVGLTVVCTNLRMDFVALLLFRYFVLMTFITLDKCEQFQDNNKSLLPNDLPISTRYNSCKQNRLGILRKKQPL